MDKQSFFGLLRPIARRLYAEGSPIFPSVRLAQSWLETGGTIPAWNNLGGLKAAGGVPNGYWKGDVVNKRTWETVGGRRVEVVASFRAYDSVGDFYKDQDLLYARSRYDAVRNAATPEAQARMLQASGYATDPAYADKLIRIISDNRLKDSDARGEEGEPMTAEERQAFDALQAAVAKLAADNAALQGKLDEQNGAMQALRDRTAQLEALHAVKEIPAWAKEAVAAAVQEKLVDSPNGASYDFYRILSVLRRAKLI
ncbi:glucosaminidase domain-containing protein [Paenibacillus sp. MWE-103]|uniref:Glucosaminidase domain-containing protein n=1 Tax=Paenibacillus artemisiicola TaxID=1172618 RepID=A0ABS3W758_9BACL|nr:glucosaminidase domain-containing protein [Paenibacillus artemisiicola]MBO7744151.1 glucosaminidase domain-containing protein [Paenibacillus artemisiicola]